MINVSVNFPIFIFHTETNYFEPLKIHLKYAFCIVPVFMRKVVTCILSKITLCDTFELCFSHFAVSFFIEARVMLFICLIHISTSMFGFITLIRCPFLHFHVRVYWLCDISEARYSHTALTHAIWKEISIVIPWHMIHNLYVYIVMSGPTELLDYVQMIYTITRTEKTTYWYEHLPKSYNCNYSTSYGGFTCTVQYTPETFTM